MELCVISGSGRKNSQSSRVATVVCETLIAAGKSPSVLDLSAIDLPLYNHQIANEQARFEETWKPISRILMAADAFVFVVPEWDGFAPPHVKNLLVYCDNQELAHKPILLCGVSAGQGGVYPLVELRSVAHKNTQALFIPFQVIFRSVGSFNPTDPNAASLMETLRYGLSTLEMYAEALTPMRVANGQLIKKFSYGV